MLAETYDISIPGRELTLEEMGRVEDLISQVSARFRREARQQFTPGESTARLKSTGGIIFLPESPVVAIIKVIGDNGRPVGFVHHGQHLAVGLRDDEFATVTYSHGGDVPDDVRMAVADAVRRVLTLDPDAVSGATQVTDTRGPFSRSRQFAAWAVGGQALLSPADVALARSYRVRPPRSWVMSS